MPRTKILLVGFGGIGKNVLSLIPQDMEVVGIVTRRPKNVLEEISLSRFRNTSLYSLDKPETYIHCGADVAVMCGGSLKDLPVQTPFFAQYFCVVDSFDTHAHIGPYIEEGTGQPMIGHLQMVNLVCLANKKTGQISEGWDPGSDSMMRAFFSACLPGHKVHAFFGRSEKGGLSMGHTNAIKRLPGVIDARQYTHARMKAIEKVRKGEGDDLTDGDKHWRECKVVLAEGASPTEVMRAIVEMPIYFAPYETIVKFVTQEELDREKSDQSHDGLVIATGPAGSMEFRSNWNSNPLGTAGILLAYARATHRANQAGRYGCFTALDFPVVDLLPNPEERVSFI